MSVEGFYRAFFTGHDGSGFLVFIMTNCKVAGADVTGGTLRGSYEVTDTGFKVKMDVHMPEGTILATDGSTVGAGGRTMHMNFELDNELGGGEPVRVETDAGPLNVIFQKIMEL